jgi:hypothetical protein
MRVELREAPEQVRDYLERLRAGLSHLGSEERERVLEETRARIDLELELKGSDPSPEVVREVLSQIGEPESLAARHRVVESEQREALPTTPLTVCRTCAHEVSTEALACPRCGAPFPWRRRWKGHGYEYRSKATLFGLPLVHVAVGRDERGKLRVAKGIIAIGQFGVGVITIAQFGVGALFGLGQFVAAPLAVGQFALGLVAIGQIAIGVLFGLGMVATGLKAIGAAVWSLLK